MTVIQPTRRAQEKKIKKTRAPERCKTKPPMNEALQAVELFKKNPRQSSD
jgi:hypothetical protein